MQPRGFLPARAAAFLHMKHTKQSILDYALASRWAGSADEVKTYANAQELLSLMQGLKDFTPAGWNAVRASLLQKGNKISTINKKLSIWRVLAACAYEQGAISQIPRARSERVQEKPERYLSREEEEKLFALMDPEYRQTAIILIQTGLRISELFNLQWSDISLDEARRMCIHNTKNGRRRYVPMTSAVHSILTERKSYCEPWGVNKMRSFEQRFLDARRRSGIEGRVTVHTLRHTFASRLVQSGVDLYKVSKLLGHTNIKTTQRYAHLADSDLEDAISVLEN